ncbi:hypothetical protein B2G71_14260 [Novosphingobium sp. PC22D]|uniref:ornithine cyclodeaminase family protein n=1 Tax=Novosphingobium sp. PC22D TaxID=1962403 RepID=UPI000BFAF5DC|nr:ornithine cyclodeaminase family protein [Novosphingobium sp. PC22D]PEQ11943.1 hypothetical protein B2G71_14260 [Novosphingobium sp. PC22D]
MIELIDGETARELVSHADAIAAMRAALAAFHRGDALLFPSMRGQGSDPSTRFGVKAAYDSASGYPGLKIGSFWPDNRQAGLPSHGSTTILLDDKTGFPCAIVEATWLNALRTAASDAVGVDLLARPDASRLAVVGTGNQAYHDVLAITLVRPLAEIAVCGRSDEQTLRLVRRLAEAGIAARAATPETALPTADIVVTATASRAPLFAAGLIGPGTHISTMGADGPGKQELPPELSRRAALFADAPAQSLEIGEFQYLAATPCADRIVPIGAVINGDSPGRTAADMITIYDSSGIGIQDIAIAALVLDRAREAGRVRQVPF